MAELAPLPPRLVDAIARVAAVLPDATPGSHIAMAFDRDHFALAATVFAAWAKGHAVALPRNARRVNVAPVVARKEVVLLAHDTGAGLGLDVPKLLARDEARRVDVAIPYLGPITCHGSTVHAWSSAQVVDACAAASFQMKPTRGTKAWNGCAAGAPGALVPGLLVPIAMGFELVEDPADAHTIVVSSLRLESLVREVGPALRMVVIANGEPPAGPVFEELARRGVRIVWPRSLLHELEDRAFDVEARVLRAPGVTDAAAVKLLDSGVACCLAASLRSSEEIRRESSLDPKFDLRCVPTLPRDADGHIDRATVLRQFGRLPDGRLAMRTLDIETLPNDGATHRFRTTLPATFFAFDGHFATYAVLSGAMQLHEVVMPCVRRTLAPAAVEPAAFHDLKFLARIAPEDPIEIAITPNDARTTCEFTIACRGKKCSTGRVVLRSGEREDAS